MLSWFRRKPAQPTYSSEHVVLTCNNAEAAARWWIQTFGCERTPTPEWDETLPSDIALRFAAAEDPTISISDRREAEQAGRTAPNHLQRVWTPELDRAREVLASRGIVPGPIEGDRVRSFKVKDLEGNEIEICEE